MIDQRYTHGSEFRDYKTGNEYVGFYFEKNGDFYGGIEATGTGYIYLVDYAIAQEAAVFRNLKKTFRKKLRAPGYFRPRPTSKDYDKAFISRYFIRNNHNKDVFEVDKNSFKYYSKKDNPIKNIYSAITFDWKISGPEFDVVSDDGTISTTGVYDTNKRTLDRHKEAMPELPTVLNFTDLAKLTS
tara:strand:- start:44116 stop:44670 length:555 start_codon:yes stop_codon:yes gene_type:complete